jgi:DNA-binding LacI/PurR family transcriptional regulator
MSNINEVAKKAGVGIGTVSRVINNSGYVKKKTREKVEKIIKEVGYVPNEIARSMALQKNNIVAFLLPNSIHLFFGELLFYVEKEMFARGYKLMMCNSSEDLDKEIAYIDMLKTNRVDAIILLTNNDIEPYLDKSFPIVSFDRRFTDVPYVASDNHQGGVMAARHLIERGCRNFMFIGDDAQGENTPVVTEVSKRRIGFFEELNKHGFQNVVNIEYPLGNYMDIPEFVFESIKDHPMIDGIFAISDAVAADVVKYLESIGRKVPEDVKVIGYDGGRSYLNLGKQVTSISQSPQRIAESLGKIIQSYYSKTEIKSYIVDVEFIQGDTT